MSVAQELKCACPHCNGRIAYPATAGGSTIQCPHCSRPVALPASAPAAPAAAVSVSAQANLKCACRHCNGRISFPPNAAGSSIACPHCGKETPLIAPGVGAAPPAAAATTAPAAQAAAPARPKVATPPVPAEEEVSAAPVKKEGGKKKLMIIVGVVLAVVVLAGGAFVVLKKKDGGGGGMSLLGPKADLQVVNYEMQKNPGTSLVYVIGTVKNNTDALHTSVRVDFKLFDAEGKQVGITSDYIMELGGKSEWPFKALVVEPGVAKVEVDKVTSSK